MSIEQKIVELLAESAKMKELELEAKDKIKKDKMKDSEEVCEDLEEAKKSKKKTSKKDDSDEDEDYYSNDSDSDEDDKMADDQEDSKDYFFDKKKKKVQKEDVSDEEESTSDIQEDIDALLFGEELTEEFKVKATTIFEAAVLSRVKAEVADLQEAFDARIDEEADQAKEEITEKVDGYLSYVVEQWMGDNELAIVNGLKSDILEGFVGGLKSLFQEHYIEVPEEKFDIVGDLQTQVDFLESKLDESLEANVSMKKHLSEMVRDNIIEDYCYGLTDTEAEKFKNLAEEIGFQNEDTFSSKLEIIKENYFTKKGKAQTTSVVTDSPISLNEDTKHVDQNVARYLETFTKINIK